MNSKYFAYRFKAWGDQHPYRPTEDVAFGVARFFQNGGVFNNYYMVMLCLKYITFISIPITLFFPY